MITSITPNVQPQPSPKPKRQFKRTPLLDRARAIVTRWVAAQMLAAQEWVDGGCDPADSQRQSAMIVFMLRPRQVDLATWLVNDLAIEYWQIAKHRPSFLPRRFDDRIAELRKASLLAAQMSVVGPNWVYTEVCQQLGLPKPDCD